MCLSRYDAGGSFGEDKRSVRFLPAGNSSLQTVSKLASPVIYALSLQPFFDQAVWVRDLAGVIACCYWARRFTLAVCMKGKNLVQGSGLEAG